MSGDRERAANAGAAMAAFRRIVRTLRLSSTASERAVGITSAQLFVLQQLAVARVSSMAELAQRTLTDPSSVSTVVAKLVRAELVERRVSAADGRRTELSLTRAGEALLEVAVEPAQARLGAALRALPEAELAGFVATLEKVVEAIGASTDQPTMFFEDEASPHRPRR